MSDLVAHEPTLERSKALTAVAMGAPRTSELEGLGVLGISVQSCDRR